MILVKIHYRWFNPEHIVSIEPNADDTATVYTSDGRQFGTRLSVDHVVGLLEDAGAETRV